MTGLSVRGRKKTGEVGLETYFVNRKVLRARSCQLCWGRGGREKKTGKKLVERVDFFR